MTVKIQLRRDTAANWASNNPIPALGEPCLETDTGVLKIGDGSTHYNTLSIISSKNTTLQSAKPTLINPTGLNRWRKALAAAYRRQATVLVEGDSITAGAYASDINPGTTADLLTWAHYGFAGIARQLFAGTFGDPGEGWITFGTDEGRWTYTGTTSSTTAGPIGTGKQLNAGAAASMTQVGPFTTFGVVVDHSTGLSAPRTLIDTVDSTPTLLTTTQAAFAVGVNDWVNRANATLAHTTSGGDNILQVTSAASGNIAAQTGLAVSCSVGQVVMVNAEIDSLTASRAWRVGVIFLDSGGAQLNELTTTDATASTIGVWQHKTALVTAPTGTVTCKAIVRVDSTAAGSEEHDFRRIHLTPVNTVTGQAGSTFYRYSITGLSDALHDVQIQTGATGTCLISGVVMRRTTSSGVLVNRVGKSGSTTADHYATAQSSSTQANQLISTYNMYPNPIDLAVIALGANDIPNQLTNGITPTVFKANLTALAAQVTGQGGCVLFVAGPRYSGEVSGGSTQAQYYQQMIDIANADANISYIDIGGEMWKDNATANAVGYMDNTNFGIHPKSFGHGDYGRALHSVLTRPMPIG